MDDLINEFITESNESLMEIDTDLLSLEQDPNNKELLGNIFRLMHTIKGTCGFLGLPRLETLAHSAENVLGRFRDGDLEVKPEYVTLIFAAIDQVRYLLDEIAQNGAEPEGEDAELKAKLDAVYEGKESGDAAVESTETAEEEASEEKSDENETAEVEAPFADLDKLLAEEAAKEAKDHKATDDAPVVTNKDIEESTSLSEESASEKETQEEPKTETVKADAPKEEDKKQPAANAEKSAPTQSLRVNVDVLEDLMTMVSELVLTRNQLLQISRAQKENDFTGPLQRLNHVVSDLQEGVMKTRMQPIGNAWAKLPRIIRDLSIDLGKKINLDMRGQDTELDRQVLDLIKDPLTHMVRNSADHGIEMPEERKAAGKDELGTVVLNAFHEGGHIIIEIEDDGKGLNTERIKEKILEKGLAKQEEIDAMSPKQIHMFIFHAGFSTAAQVTSVSGRGVGMDVVRTNIEKIGGTIELDSEEGRGSKFTIKIPLTLAIVSALIVEAGKQRFAIPQLSVQELVMVSKDGENKIERIKGTPVFRLRERLLPLITLSEMMKISSIQVDREALENKVSPVEKPEAAAATTDEEATSSQSDKETNVVSLEQFQSQADIQLEEAAGSLENSDSLTHKNADQDNHTYIIVTKVGAYTFGLIVDRVFDTEEIVVKPVPSIIKNIEIFSGNTILGDGSVVMILDPTGIARITGDISATEAESAQQRQEEEEQKRLRDLEKTSLLLFKAGLDKTPKAVPLSLVSRLEEFDVETIEYSNDRMLVQYRDELMPIVKFDQAEDLSQKERVAVLVFAEEATKSSMGLIVGDIIDIIEDHIDIKVSSDSPSLMGSAVIAGKATDVVDVGHWLKSTKKTWFGDHKGQSFVAEQAANGDPSATGLKKRVLLVDDSPFFRNMLTPLLSVAGYDVTAAEGPTEALKLKEAGRHFDVIVSDLEMPDMDGFAFAKNVKSDPEWKDTPIIALSSHDTPDDIEHGKQVGFNKHVGKYDRDTLLNTLSEALAEQSGTSEIAGEAE